MLNLRMKSRAGFWKLSAVLLVAVWGLSGCGDSGRPVEAAEEEVGSEVSFAIRLSKLAQSLLTRAEVVITAADMEEIQQELTVSGDLVSGTVKGIPAGTGRLFTLNGYDGEGTLVYTGSSAVDLPAGEVVPVRITMRRVTGPGPEIVVTLPGGAEMEMVWIEPGTFRMGSPSSEPGHEDDESPIHEVTISQGFYLGKYEITQEHWEAVVGTAPWFNQSYVKNNPDNPAVYVSWHDVQVFVHEMNVAAGDSLYRLPTEAEWEYACRAGTSTAWSFGDDENQLKDYAWYDVNASKAGENYAHPVGTKKPNPWGLYDMHGNVYEWCQDWYGSYSRGSQVDPTGPGSGADRVGRGGYFGGPARGARPADRRVGRAPSSRGYDVGARLLRTH